MTEKKRLMRGLGVARSSPKAVDPPFPLQDAMREALVRTTGRRESANDPALARGLPITIVLQWPLRISFSNESWSGRPAAGINSQFSPTATVLSHRAPPA